VLEAIDQRMRDRATAAQVAEPEGIMAVDEYPTVLAPGLHAIPLLSVYRAFRGQPDPLRLAL
jgi:hypothetical protein